MTEFRTVQESDAVPGRRLGGIAAIGIVVVFVAVATSAAFGGMLRRLPPGAPPRTAPAHLGMVEQTLIERAERGISLRDEQRAALGRYSWVDRDRGLVRIPIERAMQLRAEKAR